MNAVITGDIISSTSLPFEERKKLLEIFDKIVNDLQSLCELKCEIFRGDSFQILVEKAELALEVAVLIRAGLKMNTPENSKIIWDARVAIGVGEIEFIDDKVITSDGEAFKYSGRAFDELIKTNLTIKTRWDNINEELKLSTLFADDIISNWTEIQAFVVYKSLLLNKSQKEIADEQNKSAQNISKISVNAKEKLIRQYINRYYNLILLNQN